MRAGTGKLSRRSKQSADEWGVVLQLHMNLGHGHFFEAMIRDYEADPVQYLDRVGALGPNVLLVHMSYPKTPDEVAIIRE
jgi:cytosine/adenosine deaminase-related metal-dependent hydrolase